LIAVPGKFVRKEALDLSEDRLIDGDVEILTVNKGTLVETVSI
jgi:hypothetical protein